MNKSRTCCKCKEKLKKKKICFYKGEIYCPECYPKQPEWKIRKIARNKFFDKCKT